MIKISHVIKKIIPAFASQNPCNTLYLYLSHDPVFAFQPLSFTSQIRKEQSLLQKGRNKTFHIKCSFSSVKASFIER